MSQKNVKSLTIIAALVIVAAIATFQIFGLQRKIPSIPTVPGISITPTPLTLGREVVLVPQVFKVKPHIGTLTLKTDSTKYLPIEIDTIIDSVLIRDTIYLVTDTSGKSGTLTFLDTLVYKGNYLQENIWLKYEIGSLGPVTYFSPQIKKVGKDRKKNFFLAGVAGATVIDSVGYGSVGAVAGYKGYTVGYIRHGKRSQTYLVGFNFKF